MLGAGGQVLEAKGKRPLAKAARAQSLVLSARLAALSAWALGYPAARLTRMACPDTLPICLGGNTSYRYAEAGEVEVMEAIHNETSQHEIEITPEALKRVQGLIEERDLEGHALRVFVHGGGCSGLQYGMALESQPRETDHHYGFDGVSVVVDPQSMSYLAGSTIDYVDDLMGGGFKIENPNAVSSCGCGHSFKTSSTGASGDQHEHSAGAGGCGCH